MGKTLKFPIHNKRKYRIQEPYDTTTRRYKSMKQDQVYGISYSIIHDVFSSNPDKSIEESLQSIREPGEVSESPTILKVLMDDVAKFIGVESKVHANNMIRRIKDNLDYVYDNCHLVRSQIITKVDILKQVISSVKNDIAKTIEEYQQNYADECLTKMIESSELFKAIKHQQKASQTIDNNIEMLNALINDYPIVIDKILPENENDEEGIYHFAFVNTDTKDLVQAYIQTAYLCHKSLFGTSYGENTHTFPNQLSQVDILKNILSMWFLNEPDFTEVAQYPDVKFDDVYISLSCDEVNTHKASKKFFKDKSKQYNSIAPNILAAYFNLCRYYATQQKHLTKSSDSIILEDNDDSGSKRHKRSSVAKSPDNTPRVSSIWKEPTEYVPPPKDTNPNNIFDMTVWLANNSDSKNGSKKVSKGSKGGKSKKTKKTTKTKKARKNQKTKKQQKH